MDLLSTYLLNAMLVGYVWKVFLILGPHGNGLLSPKRAEFCLTSLEHVSHHPAS